jgi:hypothetical protein
MLYLMGRRAEQIQRSAAQRRADAVLTVIAEEKLVDPDGFDIPPHMLMRILARFLELVAQESARRPAHRPQSDPAGLSVTLLIEKGWSQADARRRVAKVLRKTHSAVARAHIRYRRESRQK